MRLLTENELKLISGGEDTTVDEIVVMGVRTQRTIHLNPNPEFSLDGATTYSVYDGVSFVPLSDEMKALLDGNFDGLDDHNEVMLQDVVDTTSWRWSDPQALRYDYQEAVRNEHEAHVIANLVLGEQAAQAAIEWFHGNRPALLTGEVARTMAQTVAARSTVGVATLILGAGAAYEAERWDDKGDALYDRMQQLGIEPSGV